MSDADEKTMQALILVLQGFVIPSSQWVLRAGLRLAGAGAKGVGALAGLAGKGAVKAGGKVADLTVGHGSLGAVSAKRIHALGRTDIAKVPEGFAREDLAALNRECRKRGISFCVNYVQNTKPPEPYSLTFLAGQDVELRDALESVAKAMGMKEKEIKEAASPAPDPKPESYGPIERDGLVWTRVPKAEGAEGGPDYWTADVAGAAGAGTFRAMAGTDGSFGVFTSTGQPVSYHGAQLSGFVPEGFTIGLGSAMFLATGQAQAVASGRLLEQNERAGLHPTGWTPKESASMTGERLGAQAISVGRAVKAPSHGQRVSRDRAPKRSM